MEKEKGNEAYRQKKFSKALKHYDNAIKLDPTNMTFLNNKAAVYFEQKDYETCRKLCLEAVEVGRNNKADYILIAKYVVDGIYRVSIFVSFLVFSCIFILVSRESDQCAVRARLGVAGHLSITPRWGILVSDYPNGSASKLGGFFFTLSL